MNKLLIIVAIFCLFDLVSMAQEPKQNLIAIKVKQDFDSWNKCSGGYPHLAEMTAIIGNDTIVGKVSPKSNEGEYSAECIFISSEIFDTIKIEDKTRGFGRKGNTFSHNDTINRKELHVGENKDKSPYSDAIKCSSIHREGYSINTTIIVDSFIDVWTLTENERIIIGENVLTLQFSKFYENNTELNLQYRCEKASDKSWKNVKRQPRIKSEGFVQLSYEDIVGPYSDYNVDYKECIGQEIYFRVVKTLLGGSKAYGYSPNARFYLPCPTFVVPNIFRPICEDSLRIKVKVDESLIHKLSIPSPKYNWRIGFDRAYRVVATIDSYDVLSENTSTGGQLLSDALQGKKDSTLFLSLEVDDERFKGTTTNPFTIYAKKDSIKAKQSDGYLFELDGKKFHLYNKKNPYVVLKITDNDTIEPGRMPYAIKNQAGKVLATITEKAEEPKLNIDTDEEFNAKIGGEEQRVAYIKNKIKQLYEKCEKANDNRINIYTTANAKYPSHSYESVYVVERGLFTNVIADGASSTGTPINSIGLGYVYSRNQSTTIVKFYQFDSKKSLPNHITQKEMNVPSSYGGGVGTFCFENGQMYWKRSDSDRTKIEGISGLNFVDQILVDNSVYILAYNSSSAYILRFSISISSSSDKKAILEEIEIKDNTVLNGLQKNPATFRNDGSFFWIENNNVKLYAKGNVTTYKTYSTPNSLAVVNITADSIRYTSNGINYIQLQNKLKYERFYSYFINNKTVWSSTRFDKDWENYRQRRWQQYLLQKFGYHIHDIEINQNDTLTLIDNDKCQYTIPYRVNVLDGLNVNLTDTVKPHDGLSNGSIRLDVYPGGDTITYYYKDQKIEGHITDDLTNLPWGETIIPFTDESGDNILYTHSLFLLPNVTFEVKPQTCSSPNGEIIVKGIDATNCTQWQHKNVSMPDSEANWRSGLNNLKAGEYKVRGLFGNNTIPFDTTLIVHNEIFDVSVGSIADATTIGGTGSVELKIENQTKDITWTDTDTQATYSDYKQAIFTARKYNWTATHSLDECEVHVSFEIKAPKVELVNASVTYNADTKEAHVHVEGKKNDFVSSYQFTVGGETFTNDITLSGKNAGNTIPLGLKYTSTIDNKEYTTDIKRITLLSYTPQVTVNTEFNNKRCPSQPGRVTLSGASGGELAVDNSNQYKKIEKDGSLDIPNNPNDTIHTLHFRKTETISTTGFGEIENVTVRDISNVVIAEPQKPSVIVDASNVTCKGSKDGKLYITETKNIRREAQYSLDNKKWHSLSDTIKFLVPKIYTIYTRDSDCPSDTVSSYIEIREPSDSLIVSIPNDSIFNPTCRENDGKIVLKASGGWDDYLAYTRKLTAEEYENALDTTDIDKKLRIEGLKFGNHTIYVHDGGGCVVAVKADLKQYDSPQITDTTTIPARCYGSADGEIVINAVTVDCSIEDKPLSLLIEGRSDTLILTTPYKTTIKDLSKGFYKLQLMDVNGCQSDILNVPISQPEPLKVEARLLDGGRIRYKGGNTGRMEVKVSGGNAGIDSVFYNNSNVLVSTNVPYIVEGMSAGPIVISANDKNGCPSNDTTLTFIEPDEPITIEAESQAALCHAQTGSVKVTATGGWGDHRIRLVGERESRNSGDKSETTFESLYAGDYKIEVEDKYGAKATQSVRVDAPEPISHELITSPDHCDGNGSATIKLSGGMPDYTTIFVVGTDTTKIAGSTVNIGNLVGGREYTLTTRDANTCESVIAFPQPDNRLKAEIKYVYNANGSATLTAEVRGGIAPYTYKWRNVSSNEELGTSATQTITKSGIYRLDIADASGCSDTTMQNVLMLGSLRMKVKSVTRTTNPKNNDGTATIICKATKSANIRMYHLESETWTAVKSMPNDTTIKLNSLRSGTYSVIGDLDNGNVQMAMFEIKPYVKMNVIKIDVKHVSAPGRHDASVVVDFDGGIAPYVLNNATYPTSHIELNNLEAGKITLSIVDSTGNVLANEVEIREPDPLIVTPSKVDDASCHDYSNGSVLLTATGGWPGYQFAKGNGKYENSAYFGSLNAGERIFKVVDKYGVEDSVKVTIGEPDMLRASVATIDSVKCKGYNNGAAHFTVIGGTAPYRTIYEKETLDGTDVENLLSGTYVMKFTDSHNCKSPDTISIYIPEPEQLEVASDEVVNTTCELDNGKIAIEVKGGSLPYRYEWTENGGEYSGAKTVNMVRSEAEKLKQNGLYHIDITDLHGCHTQYEKRIEHSENPRVLGVATTDVLCYGSSDGIAEVDSSQVKWGYPKANYSLTWPQGQTGVMSVNTLPAGIHSVRITDDNNCTTTREFTVGTPEPVKNHLASVRDALCYSYSDGRIETHTTGGVGDYTYVWNTGETTSYADSLKAGMYKVVVTDSHECKDSATYEVTEPEELKINLGDDVLICPGNVHVFDAGEYATYSWSNVASGEEIETERHLATGEEGDYAIKVTNEIGCIARDTVNMAIGENALKAEFLMASDAAVNDTIMLIRLSNMPVDSVRWQYDKLMAVDVEEAEEYMFPLMAESTGRYYITMWAYSGGCESFEQKFIDIYEAVEDSSNFKIGYDPLIKQAKVSPNPNDGEFSLIVVLREKADVDVMVHDVNNGRQVEHVVLKDSDKYNTRLNIRQWGSGIFVLSIVSGSERRAIKVLCVR